jgi:hypothetical protein
LIDPSGLDCRDDEDAMDQAVVIARQIAADAPETSAVRHVAILDSEREEIGKVPVKRTGPRLPEAGPQAPSQPGNS